MSFFSRFFRWFGVVLLSVFCVAYANAETASNPIDNADIRVHLLGTGSPLPLTYRFGPATLVEAGGEKFLFDAGRGNIQRLHTLGIPFDDVDKLFLTHLHSDHTIGIPDLYLTGWLRGRKKPLQVWGPEGTKKMMDAMVDAFDYDIKIRLDQNPGSDVETTEFTEGVVYDKDGVTITAFTVDHGVVKPAVGYRIDYNGRSVVLSGDTRYSEAVIEQAKGVDLLVHEVAAASDEMAEKVPAIPRILDIHTTPEEAAKVFSKAAPKMAVYSHIVLFGVDEDELEKTTRAHYDGPLIIGEDLMTFHIGDTVRMTKEFADY